MRGTRWMAGVGMLALLGACGGAGRGTATTGATPAPAAEVRAAAAADPHAGHRATAAPASPDERFIRDMIAHHAQAMEMSALAPQRAARPDLRLLAERIDASQRHEISLMEAWLRARGLPVPTAGGEHAHHGPAEHEAMAGMATPAEMARLAASTGAEFDRLFLELMIRHHEGALTMVAQLLSSPGARDREVYRLASDVDADQRAEIARMRRLQQGPGPTP